jgi:hypothetical protein
MIAISELLDRAVCWKAIAMIKAQARICLANRPTPT